jgi:putative transposase
LKQRRFTEEQIVRAVRQAESGVPVVEVCRKLGITAQTCSRWRRAFGGMGVVEQRRLRCLVPNRPRRLRAKWTWQRCQLAP